MAKATQSETPSGGVVRTFAQALWHRRRGLAAGAMLAGLAVICALAWQVARQQMRADPRYQVTAASIEIADPPPWVRTDIRLEALRDANLRGGLSVLDPPEQLQQRVADAFQFHPWVESVGKIQTLPPNRVQVELTYRRPLAAVEVEGQAGKLAVIDRHGVRLPSGDLTPVELRYLPRIRQIESTTLPGELWRDHRVLGAVELVAALGQHWRGLDLIEIRPSTSLRVRGDLRYYSYEMLTLGGTRIQWGPKPSALPTGEPPFEQKLRWLVDYVASNGPLRSSYGTPATIDLREGFSIVQRTAKKADAKDEPSDPVLK